MSTERFELAVIGEGQGGKTLAVQTALAGRKVAMIERGHDRWRLHHRRLHPDKN